MQQVPEAQASLLHTLRTEKGSGPPALVGRRDDTRDLDFKSQIQDFKFSLKEVDSCSPIRSRTGFAGMTKGRWGEGRGEMGKWVEGRCDWGIDSSTRLRLGRNDILRREQGVAHPTLMGRGS